MLDVATQIERFFHHVASGDIDLYNECSLQYELAVFLRRSFVSSSYKVQFERPVAFFGLRRSEFIKNEIDITVFSSDQTARIAIEVKFPRNGQYPEQMFRFCQDVAFLEQLVSAGFNAGLFVVAADDPLFYSGGQQSGIYGPFRGNHPLTGTITKPTGKRDESVHLRGEYNIVWRDAGQLKYACVRAKPLHQNSCPTLISSQLS